MLALIAGRVPLLIELKDQTADHGAQRRPAGSRHRRTPCKATAGEVAVMSFNPHMVHHMARLAPQIPRGLTTVGL